MLPAESDREPSILGVDDVAPDSVAENASALALISDWQDMEVESLESARDDIRSKYWRYWSAQLLGELIIGLPPDLERDTIMYLDSLLTSNALPNEVVGDLLKAPLSRPENARRLAPVAGALGCEKVAKALRAVAEAQPRLDTLFRVWRSLAPEHFAALGLPREELWRRLVDGDAIPTLLAAPQVRFLERWLECTLDEVDESTSPAIRQTLRKVGQDLEGLLYRRSSIFSQEDRDLSAIGPVVKPMGELRAYYQKHYGYSYQGTLWDDAIRSLLRSYHFPPPRLGRVDPAPFASADESAGLAPLALQTHLDAKVEPGRFDRNPLAVAA